MNIDSNWSLKKKLNSYERELLYILFDSINLPAHPIMRNYESRWKDFPFLFHERGTNFINAADNSYFKEYQKKYPKVRYVTLVNCLKETINEQTKRELETSREDKQSAEGSTKVGSSLY